MQALSTCPSGVRVLEVAPGDDCSMDGEQLGAIAGGAAGPVMPATPDGDAGAVFLLGSAFGSPGGAPMVGGARVCVPACGASALAWVCTCLYVRLCVCARVFPNKHPGGGGRKGLEVIMCVCVHSCVQGSLTMMHLGWGAPHACPAGLQSVHTSVTPLQHRALQLPPPPPPFPR